MNELDDNIINKSVNSAPKWILAIAGSIAILMIVAAMSFRIMDFNPGPLWEKSIELDLEIKRASQQCEIDQSIINQVNENTLSIEILTGDSHKPGG